MLITLEVLKEKGATELDVNSFKNLFFFRKYRVFTSDMELSPIELIKTGKDKIFKPLLIYSCIDTLEELREVVEWHIKTDKVGADYSTILHYTFEYCQQLYTQDLKLFKKAVNHHCKALKNYVDSLDA